MKFSDLDLNEMWQAVSVQYESSADPTDRAIFQMLLQECEQFQKSIRSALERKFTVPPPQRGAAA